MTDARDESATRVAVVTGAAQGIGLAVAHRLAKEGVLVVGVDRDELALAAAQTAVGKRFQSLVGDIGRWETHEAAAQAAARVGRLAYWVNNAGIDWVGAAHEVNAAHIDDGLRVLLNGPLYGTAVAVRHMLETGAGAIVNISSIQGIAAFPRYYVYDAAKAGVLMATRNVAVDYGAFGIRCNAILPGTIETPMTYSTLPTGIPTEEALEREGELAPMRRVGQPDEVAEAVWFLLSESASYINGEGLVVDGGASARCFPYPALTINGEADLLVDTREKR